MIPKTIDDVAEQIKRTCQIYRLLPAVHAMGFKSSLKSLTPDTQKKYFSHITPKEFDMADEVEFKWLSCLLPNERRLVWKRFDGMPWKILAYEENLSIRQARYQVQQALKKILKHIKKINKNHTLN